jgi:hypothetical protein
MTNKVRGAGGGKGGSARTPREERDTLRSTQVADVIDLISEGECTGLVNGLKDVYLDGVPIENDDGSRNFDGVDFAWTAGTQGQPAMSGLPGVQTERGVGVVVEAATPVVRSITSDQVDQVRVTIGIPQLSRQDLKTGDLLGSSFEWAIEVQSQGGGYVEVYRRTVSGKCMSLYTRSVLLNLSGGAPYDIRVRRLTADSTQSNVTNAFSWVSYTEIQQVKLRYPHRAIARLIVNAEQFSRIPVRSYRWRGVHIKVPTNYDPITRQYTGMWDGTFKLAWSNNPAWVLHEMVTNPRWGLGQFVSEEINNKWVLYRIGQYCDALVPDGRGGTEPRFTFNWQFTTRAEAVRVLRDLSAVFRGVIYWGNSSVEYSQDAPAEPELLYTPASVIDGEFSYQDTSEKSLHSVFIAYWNDLSQQGKRVPEVYAPDDLIARYGVREIAFDLLGCTSRGQAARMCRWARYSEQYEGTLITFKVGSDGAICAPGKVFQVADPSEATERLGGRIRAATTTRVELDAPVTLAAAESYTLTVVLPKSGTNLETVTETRPVVTAAGETGVIDVFPAFSTPPEAATIWVLQSNNIAASTWRCIGVKETKGGREFEIIGVAHNPSKFDAIELGLQLDEIPISRMQAKVLPPASLALVETVYTDGTINKSKVTASWLPSARNLQHTVYWRRDDEWWQQLPTTDAQTVDIGPLDPGVYEVKVTSTNALGSVSPAAQASITVAGGPSGVRAVRLRASSLQFKVDAGGVATPASIDITADLGALSAEPTWSVVSGVATLTGTGLAKSLAYVDMVSETVTISVTVEELDETYSELVTILKVRDGLPGVPGDAGAPGAPGAPGDDGAPGADGSDAVYGQLSLDVIALVAEGNGAVTGYTGAFTTLLVFEGTDLSAGWTFTRVDGPGVVSTIAGATVTVTSMDLGQDSSYIDITATRAGYASITKRAAVVKMKTGAQGEVGDPGPRGTVQIAAAVATPAWSDAAALDALTDAGYSGPRNRDIVTLYTDTWSEARFYSDGAWLPVAAYISGNLLVEGTVGARELVVDEAIITNEAQMGSAVIGRAAMKEASIGEAEIDELAVSRSKIKIAAVGTLQIEEESVFLSVYSFIPRIDVYDATCRISDFEVQIAAAAIAGLPGPGTGIVLFNTRKAATDARTVTFCDSPGSSNFNSQESEEIIAYAWSAFGPAKFFYLDVRVNGQTRYTVASAYNGQQFPSVARFTRFACSVPLVTGANNVTVHLRIAQSSYAQRMSVLYFVPPSDMIVFSGKR